jgi:hypothetical protein
MYRSAASVADAPAHFAGIRRGEHLRRLAPATGSRCAPEPPQGNLQLGDDVGATEPTETSEQVERGILPRSSRSPVSSPSALRPLWPKLG